MKNYLPPNHCTCIFFLFVFRCRLYWKESYSFMLKIVFYWNVHMKTTKITQNYVLNILLKQHTSNAKDIFSIQNILIVWGIRGFFIVWNKNWEVHFPYSCKQNTATTPNNEGRYPYYYEQIKSSYAYVFTEQATSCNSHNSDIH